MKVCIAEKPSVAKEIARVLGAKNRKNGYFEGNGYCVTWTYGHLCELEEPAYYNATWKHWNMNQLPMFPVKFETRLIEDKGIREQFSIIQSLLNRCEMVINCGDAGQEGELIQRWVLKKANYEKRHQRLWISSLTDEAIRNGFQRLHPSTAFDNLYHAGLVRAIGDWLLGINATRAYSLKFGGRNELLSVGRVQTPTLAMVVNRHKEIQNFKPEPYWKLYTEFKKTKFFHTKNPFKKKEEAEAIIPEVQQEPFRIIKKEEKEVRIPPMRLFDLTTLQVECNRRFAFSADRTLKIAQQLYEKKVITYPRVDTQYLSDDVYRNIPGIITGLSKNPNYGEYTKQVPAKPKKSRRYFNNNQVTDHHAIIPTNQGNPSLPPDEFRVYDLIVRRFLAIFYPDAIEFKTKVTAETGKHRWEANGKVLKDPGWQTVYPITSRTPRKGKEQKEDEQRIPPFERSEEGPHTPGIEEKETQPPKKYTEATLLRAMESCGRMVDDEALKEALKANGIGRPSTRASILETLFRREYLYREKKNILPTEKGIALIDSIQNETLKSPALTGEWENKLRQIESGSFKGGLFLKELNRFVESIVGEVKSAAGVQRVAQVQGIAPCPKCKTGQIVDGVKAYGCSEWRCGCDFKIWKTIAKKKISLNQAKTLLKDGKTKEIRGFTSKQGKKFNATLVLDQQFDVKLEF